MNKLIKAAVFSESCGKYNHHTIVYGNLILVASGLGAVVKDASGARIAINL